MDNNKYYNNEAESMLLGILLIDNSKVPTVKALLSADDFYVVAHRHIYSTIISMVDKGKVADIVTVSEELDFHNLLDSVGSRSYINDLALNVITSTAYKNYCNIIVNYAKKRKLIILCEDAINSLGDNKDINDVAIDIKTNIENIMINKGSNSLSHIVSGLEPVVEQIEEIMKSESKLLGCPTPFHKLNSMLSGLVKGRLYILGARPSMGKSSFVMQLARTTAVNRNVVLASLEMGLEEYTQREIFSMINTNQDMISNGNVGEEIFSKIYSAGEKLSDLNLFIIDNPECTLNDIENAIINCISKNGTCDLVCVDYLQLMKSDNKKVKDTYEVVTANSKGLKVLARKYNVPIVALCQLSRALEMRPDKRPILSDLRESGSIEQDADVVMFLYRDEYYNPTADNIGHAEIIVRKNRQGRNGTIDLIFDASRTRFVERR